MDIRSNQHAVVEFLAAEGCQTIEIHRRMTAGSKTMDVTRVRFWLRKSEDPQYNASKRQRQGYQ